MFFSCKLYSITIESNNTTKRHIGFAESQYGILYGHIITHSFTYMLDYTTSKRKTVLNQS